MGLSEVEDGSQRVVLYYTELGTRGGTQEAASFKMGDLTGRWARFTLTVQGSEVGGAPAGCVSHLQMSAVTQRRCGLKGGFCHGQRWCKDVSLASCHSGATLHGL